MHSKKLLTKTHAVRVQLLTYKLDDNNSTINFRSSTIRSFIKLYVPILYNVY